MTLMELVHWATEFAEDWGEFRIVLQADCDEGPWTHEYTKVNVHYDVEAGTLTLKGEVA